MPLVLVMIALSVRVVAVQIPELDSWIDFVDEPPSDLFKLVSSTALHGTVLTDPLGTAIKKQVGDILRDDEPIVGVIDALIDDRFHHPMNLVDRLTDNGTHSTALDTLQTIIKRRNLGTCFPTQTNASQCLNSFLAAHVESSGLFLPPSKLVNYDAAGRSRKQSYVDANRQAARAVGLHRTPEQLLLVERYASQLAAVVPLVISDIQTLARTITPIAWVSGRAKSAVGLLDKVQRMRKGDNGRPSRPTYMIGDVIDAIGVRITVPSTRTLYDTLSAVQLHYGIGDGGRILEIENFYSSPPVSRAYRVIPMVLALSYSGGCNTR